MGKTKVAQKQYSSLLEGLRAVGQVKGWQTQQIVFVGGLVDQREIERDRERESFIRNYSP